MNQDNQDASRTAEIETPPTDSPPAAQKQQGKNSSGWKSKKILINANLPGETRVALVEGGRLQELNIERADIPEYRNSLFKGKVGSVNESLGAAFVSIGLERDGFLPLNESRNTSAEDAPEEEAAPLKVGDEVLVQLVHEQPGTGKGPLLRRDISLTGKYVILLPRSPGARRLPRGLSPTQRQQMVNLSGKMKLPEDSGIVLRKRALGAGLPLVQEELDDLIDTWKRIDQQASACSAPSLLLLDGDLVFRTIRDQVGPQIVNIVIDDEPTCDKVKQLLGRMMPEYLEKVVLHSKPTPLFHEHQIDQALAQASQRKISLPSGGEIVIDRTEALVAVDVNSRGSRNKDGFEAIALKTNLEAIEEIAWQLRLRDIGGLVVIDFIDMDVEDSRRQLEETAESILARDPARTANTALSSLGLMELSRQRMGMELAHSNALPCEHCDGRGWIEDDYSFALKLLREVQNKAGDSPSSDIRLEAPYRIANLLVNELRTSVVRLEQRTSTRLQILAHPHQEPPFYRIKVKKSREGQQESEALSSQAELSVDGNLLQPRNAARNNNPDPLVDRVAMATAQSAPADEAPAETSGGKGWLAPLFGLFKGRAAAEDEDKPRGRSRRRSGSRQSAASRDKRRGSSQSSRRSAPPEAVKKNRPSKPRRSRPSGNTRQRPSGSRPPQSADASGQSPASGQPRAQSRQPADASGQPPASGQPSAQPRQSADASGQPPASGQPRAQSRQSSDTSGQSPASGQPSTQSRQSAANGPSPKSPRPGNDPRANDAASSSGQPGAQPKSPAAGAGQSAPASGTAEPATARRPSDSSAGTD